MQMLHLVEWEVGRVKKLMLWDDDEVTEIEIYITNMKPECYPTGEPCYVIGYIPYWNPES